MPCSDGAAMEAGPSCPVLSAWKQSPVVMSQLLKDKLVIVQYASLSRMRPTVPAIAEYLKRFYTNELPISRKVPAGNASSAAGDEAGESSEEDDDEGGEGGESEEASEDMVIDDAPELPGGAPESHLKPISEEVVAAPDPLPEASTSSAPVEIDSECDSSDSSLGVLVVVVDCDTAKKKGKHYFVKDRTYGYRCLNCDCASQELDILKALQCLPPKGSEARVQATDDAEIELEKLRDLEAEGLQLQELLKFEQEQLEEMMLQAELDELERQVAQEEYELHEAKVRSLEEAAIQASKRSVDAEPPAASDAKRTAAAAGDANQVDPTATAGNAEQVDPAKAASNAKQRDPTETAGDAKQVDPTEAAGNAKQVDPTEAAGVMVDPASARDKLELATPRDAKRPRMEQSSTAVVSRGCSGDAETLAQNALLHEPSMPPGRGPDCFDTLPYDCDPNDIGLEQESNGIGDVGKGQHLQIPQLSLMMQATTLCTMSPPVRVEPLSPAEQTQLSGAKKAAAKGRPRRSRKRVGDAESGEEEDDEEIVLKRPKTKANQKISARLRLRRPTVRHPDSKVEPPTWCWMHMNDGCLQSGIVSKDGKSEPPEQVLLLRWMTSLNFEEKYEFFELFSGEGKVTQFWHSSGLSTASFDKLYGDPMNFLENQGFSIALWVVLNECPDAFNLIGPDCSRHVDKNGRRRFTGRRDELKMSGCLGGKRPWLARLYREGFYGGVGCLVGRLPKPPLYNYIWVATWPCSRSFVDYKNLPILYAPEAANSIHTQTPKHFKLSGFK
ncbi:unnamed protein product [Symbiodinium sp. CCMP2456]|nr:unnamed protein product [Symbiodinium sp. CCMP2456]